MRGTRATCLFAVALLAAMPAATGCKKGKDSTNAADAKKSPPLPSGTMSLQGMVRYMADAGLFLDCATREQWPVAMEGDNAALERAYRRAKVEAGSPLLVTVEGRLEPRGKADSRGSETNLIVERFVCTWPRETCGSMNEVTLEDTHWVLLELNGKPITANTNGDAPTLELNSKKASAFGFGGCNRYFSSYEVNGLLLRFSAIGATRMACPEGMPQEQALFTALDSTTRYEIHSGKLLLFADEAPVARFEAKPKPE